MAKKTKTEPEAKAAIIQLRATEADKERWQAAADADRRSLSDWLRIAADDKADRQGQSGRR